MCSSTGLVGAVVASSTAMKAVIFYKKEIHVVSDNISYHLHNGIWNFLSSTVLFLE